MRQLSLLALSLLLSIQSEAFGCRMVCTGASVPTTLILCDNVGEEGFYGVLWGSEEVVAELKCHFGKKDPFQSYCTNKEAGGDYVVRTIPVVAEETSSEISDKKKIVKKVRKRKYLDFIVERTKKAKEADDEEVEEKESKFPKTFRVRFDQDQKNCLVLADR